MARLVGSPIEPSSEPLSDPWMGRMDGTRLRSLGFRPTVATVYQAAQQGILWAMRLAEPVDSRERT
jgi:UDP-glucose 4-epimerase